MNAALLRKELFPLLWETLLSVLVAVAGLAFAGEDVLPWGPPLAGVGDGLPLVALGLLLTGLALGMWQFEVERSAGTQAWLHQRATGARGAFRAKVAAAWISLATLWLGTLLLHAAWTRFTSPWGAALDLSRLAPYLALGVLAFCGHALGAWAAHLPRAERSARLGAAFLGACSLYFLGAQLSLRWGGEQAAPIVRFVLVMLGVGAALLAGAGRLARARLEPERAPGVAHSLHIALVGVLVLGPGVAMTPLSLQGLLDKGARRSAPRIVFDAQGRPAVASSTGLPGDDLLFDARSTPLAWGLDGPPPLVRSFPGEPFELRPATLTLLGGDVDRPLGWYDEAARLFRVYEWQGERLVGLRTLGLFGQPLPAGSLPIFGWDAPSVAFVDPGAGRAWRLHRTPEGVRLDEAPLPEGRRLLGVERVHWRRRARAGLLEPYGVSDQLVVRAQDGPWTWTADGWAPFVPEDDDVLESGLDGVAVVRVARAGDGLLPRVEVRAADGGELLLEAPAAVHGEASLLLAQGLSALRPPLLVGWSASRPLSDLDRPRAALDAWTRDLALVDARRRWLLAAALALSALQALAVRWHLGRAPHERGLRAAWTLAVVLLGLPAAIAAGLLEPQRPRRA